MNPIPITHVLAAVGSASGGGGGDDKFSGTIMLARDRLTQLPDAILLHILSFLPIKHAIRTSLISKSCVNLWTQLSALDFLFDSENRDPEGIDMRKFTSFVDRALLFHSSEYIHKFCVSFDFYPRHHEQQVHSWLRFLVNRKVEHIKLMFDWMAVSAEFYPDLQYNMPSFMFQNDLLMTMKLKNCQFPLDREIRYPSLRSLALGECYLSDRVVAKLLLGCPLLQRFELFRCVGMSNLIVSHDGLKELVIESFAGEIGGNDFHERLTISAPNLRSLSLGVIIVVEFRVSALSSLEEAVIEFCYVTPPDIEEIRTWVKDLLARMPVVKKLTFGSESLEAVSLLNSTDAPFSLPSCTSLVLLAYLNRSLLPGLAWLLRSCSQLETLTFYRTTRSLSSWYDGNPGTGFWMSQPNDGYYEFLDHLKYVNVIGLAPNHPEVDYVTEFLQFLLEHGKVLKKICIMSDDRDDRKGLFKLAQTLLRFPRLSREAEIRLDVRLKGTP